MKRRPNARAVGQIEMHGLLVVHRQQVHAGDLAESVAGKLIAVRGDATKGETSTVHSQQHEPPVIEQHVAKEHADETVAGHSGKRRRPLHQSGKSAIGDFLCIAVGVLPIHLPV